MNMRDSPWFAFDVLAWRASPRVQKMDAPTRACYLEMLIHQWEHGSAPASPETCAARLCFPVDVWRASWAQLEACFDRRRGGLVNRRLDRARRDRNVFLDEQRRKGKLGGRHRETIEPTGDQPNPRPTRGLADANPTLSPDQIRSDQIRSKDHKKDQPASRATRSQAVENSEPAPKRARVADEPTADGNLSLIVKLAHDVLNAAAPDTPGSEIVERVKDACAAARIDYGDHPDVRGDVVQHAITIATMRRRARGPEPYEPRTGKGFTSIGAIARGKGRTS